MLIGTLPTLMGDRSLIISEQMIAHSAVSGVRYNTGGDSPFNPKEILFRIKKLTDKYKKVLYVDLEGRQLRIAHWTPHDSGVITLNRSFDVSPPARAHIRNVGWFDLIAANLKQRKIYLENGPELGEYYFGESQSVHVVGGGFRVQGYLGGLDTQYIEAAIALGINHFMLSFFETSSDAKEFYQRFPRDIRAKQKVIFKIESQKGLEEIARIKLTSQQNLMAARDDFFLSYGGRSAEVITGLKKIISADPNAIVASGLLSGLQTAGMLSVNDISDVFLMIKMGYKNFMFSDGWARKFQEAAEFWMQIISYLRNETL